MIKSISIRNVATYDNTGIQINDLKKVNFIYGANGCGKTTISNFLQDAEDGKFNNCSLVWNSGQPIKTLVYNKGFRRRNFGKGKISGVFTLGEATADEIKIIEEKIEALKVIKADGAKKRETLLSQTQKKEKAENDFKEVCWIKIYKKYELVFKEAFVGWQTKENFKGKLLQEFQNNKSTIFPLDELKEKAKTIFGKTPQNITPINTFNFDRIADIVNNKIWQKIIVGKADVDLAKLIQKLNINDWVNQGRNYLLEDNICPFCQKETITEDFKKQLESYFDESYLNDIKSVKDLKQEYIFLMENLINGLNTIEKYNKEFKETKLDIDTYSAYLKTLISQDTINNELLNNKVKEPSRSIGLVPIKDQLDLIGMLITEANSEIKKHNDIVSNFKTEKENLIRSIWRYIVEEFKADITKFNSEINGLQTGINALNTQLKDKILEHNILNDEIKNLNKNVTSIQPTIDEINRLLKYYGFLNFEIVPAKEEGFYQIQREDGTIAETTLSEGEITFITFLYFLQLAKGGDSEETVNDERILIIDDPISSLDSTVLFVVSTLIKEIIKGVKSDTGNIKQIILLTHNVYFHKEVSFIDGRTKKCSNTNYWIIRKNNSKSLITPYYENNPIQSSYELLWREIKEWEKNSGITIQNTLRRIIENYFSMLGTRRDDILIAKFKTKEEQEICRSLLSWINEGSHTMPDDLFVESPEGTIEKYLSVFKEIFIHTDNAGHYHMMMGTSEEKEQETQFSSIN